VLIKEAKGDTIVHVMLCVVSTKAEYWIVVLNISICNEVITSGSNTATLHIASERVMYWIHYTIINLTDFLLLYLCSCVYGDKGDHVVKFPSSRVSTLDPLLRRKLKLNYCRLHLLT
jgi:hypothetical protein